MRATLSYIRRAGSVPAVVACALAALAAAAPVWGGAWAQPRDSYYFKLSVSYLDTGRELNFNGEEVDILSGEASLTNTSYRDVTVSAYLEYGLTDRLTVLGTLPFKVLTSQRTELSEVAGLRRDIKSTNGGLGDLALGMRYPLVTGALPVSLQAGARFPLGYDNRPDNMGPPLGSGRVDIEGHLLAGVNLYPVPGYITGGVGYRVRGGDVDDEMLFALEGGVNFGRIMARVGVDGVYSTGDPPDLSAGGDGQVSSAVVVTDQDILKFTPGLGVQLTDEISLAFEAFHVVDGKNTVAGTTWSVGIAFRQ